MKNNRAATSVLIILTFTLVVIFPYITTLLGVKNELYGALEKEELTFQNLDNYILQNFPGRSFLIKTKNQLLYSLFDVSPNASITKNGDMLFATESLNYFYHGLYNVDDENVSNLISKFQKLNDYCKANDKNLLLIITPTKARYFNGNLPFADDIISAYQKEKYRLPYDIFKAKINKTNIKCFDAIEYIDNHKEELTADSVPLFYKSGHHWSLYKSNIIALALHDLIRKEFNFPVPKLSIKATPSDVPIYPDADLFNVLNIYDKPNEKFYNSIVTYENYDLNDKIYTIRGGSFLSGLLIPQLTVSPFSKTYYLDNKVIFSNNFADYEQFETYDELDEKYKMIDHINNTNVFIFEINELNVYNASFGFLDYVLEHLEGV